MAFYSFFWGNVIVKTLVPFGMVSLEICWVEDTAFHPKWTDGYIGCKFRGLWDIPVLWIVFALVTKRFICDAKIAFFRKICHVYLPDGCEKTLENFVTLWSNFLEFLWVNNVQAIYFSKQFVIVGDHCLAKWTDESRRNNFAFGLKCG